MAFHDKYKDGAMKQFTIVSLLDSDRTDLQDLFKEHDDKVSKFNQEHNVFFNQIVPTIRLGTSQILVSTVCLYADGK